MKIQEKVHIKVLNRSNIKVCASGRTRSYVFMPATDGIPTFEFMGFDDIEYINSHSPIFRTGGLCFEDNEKEEIFEALKYPKWKDTVITEENIEDIIFNPTEDTQRKVVAITDMATIERIRGRLVFCLNEGMEGISTHNEKLIKERYKELCQNKAKSKINVSVLPEKKEDPEIKDLKEQLSLMQKQLAKFIDVNKTNESEPKKPSNKKSPAKKAVKENEVKEKSKE